jgi:sphingolipid delta-4 desaturase
MSVEPASVLEPSEAPTPHAGPDAYIVVTHSQPHPERAQRILATHPEVRRLFGFSHASAVLIVAIVGFQIAMAYAVSEWPLWQIVLVSFFVGAFADHAQWVLVHECAHNLVFRRKSLNRWAALVANIPFVLPSTVNFCIYHLMHHRHLGSYHNDADIAPRWEAWLLRHGFLGRLTWMCFYPFTQGIRSYQIDNRGRPGSWVPWIVPNYVFQITAMLLLLYFCGRHTFRYLIASVFFSIGPHPLGARWIQEHYVFRDGQETYSYYGPLNVVSLNIGYHNEHHDLPQIPWHRLPALKRLAPEMYDGLYRHTSLVGLWLRFLFDRHLQVYRIGRGE